MHITKPLTFDEKKQRWKPEYANILPKSLREVRLCHQPGAIPKRASKKTIQGSVFLAAFLPSDIVQHDELQLRPL